MEGVDKTFGATVALSGAHLRVEAGEVRALIGENGAGKSTLMRILSVVESPDSGTIRIAGELFSPANPQQAREGGIAMVHQELAVVEDLTVEENLLLGREPSRGGVFLPARMRERVISSLELLGRVDIQPSTPVARLSVAARQLVEIARALVHDAPVIVFDEPTSSLGLQDIEHLFEVIDRLREDGRAVVYISHFLEEVQSVADTWRRAQQSCGAGERISVLACKGPQFLEGFRRCGSDSIGKIEHVVSWFLGVSGSRPGQVRSISVSLELRLSRAGLSQRGAETRETLRCSFYRFPRNPIVVRPEVGVGGS